MTFATGLLAVIALAIGVLVTTQRRRGERTEPAAIPLAPPAPSWPASIGAPCDLSSRERTEIVERLDVLGDEWSIGILETALDDEHDASVREAVWQALLRLRAS